MQVFEWGGYFELMSVFCDSVKRPLFRVRPAARRLVSDQCDQTRASMVHVHEGQCTTMCVWPHPNLDSDQHVLRHALHTPYCQNVFLSVASSVYRRSFHIDRCCSSERCVNTATVLVRGSHFSECTYVVYRGRRAIIHD